MAAYLDALAVNPRHVDAAVRAAAMLIGAQRAADATQAARGLLSVRGPVNPALLEGLNALAFAEAMQGRHDAAVNVLRHAAAIGPSAWGPNLLYALAGCYEARNENGPARMTMRQALTLLPEGDPRRPQFDRYLEALELASRTAAGGAAPGHPTGLGLLPPPPAGDSPDSAASKPATAPPPSPPAGNPVETRATELAAKAAVLAGEGKVEEAIALLKEAVQLAPKLPAPSAQLAALHVRQRKYAEAVAVLETAIRHNPDNVVLKQMLEKLRNALAADSQPGG